MGRLGMLLLLELRRRLRDPLSLVTWMAIPFLMVALMVVVFGPGDTGLPRITVLVVDEDGGIVSRLLVSALDSPQAADLFDVRLVEMAEARRIMDRGGASALVVVPEGFGRSFLDGEPVVLQVWKNPQESLLPGIAVEALTFLARTAALARRVLQPVAGNLFRGGGEGPPTLDEVLHVARRTYGLLQRPGVRRVLDPRTLAVVEHHPGDGGAPTRSEVVGWFAPGMVALALLFLCNGQTQDLQEDLLKGHLARAWTFASPRRTALGAKAAALVLSASTSGLLLAAALSLVLGWRPGPPGLLVLHTVATAAAFTGLALWLRSFTTSTEGGGAASSGVMVGLAFLGGCFVPTVFLPPFLQGVARLIPTGWAVQGYLILQGGTWAEAPGSLSARILALLATAGVTFALASRNMGGKAVAR